MIYGHICFSIFPGPLQHKKTGPEKDPVLSDIHYLIILTVILYAIRAPTIGRNLEYNLFRLSIMLHSILYVFHCLLLL